MCSTFRDENVGPWLFRVKTLCLSFDILMLEIIGNHVNILVQDESSDTRRQEHRRHFGELVRTSRAALSMVTYSPPLIIVQSQLVLANPKKPKRCCPPKSPKARGCVFGRHPKPSESKAVQRRWMQPWVSADSVSGWQSLTASTTHRNERPPMAGDPPNRALQRHRCRRGDALSKSPGLVPSGLGRQP